MSIRPIALPPWIAALALAALAVAGGALATRLTTDNRLDRMLSEHGPEAALYHEFLEHYGSDEFVIAAITGKTILDADTFDLMLDAYEQLLEVPYVDQVSGIPQLYLERFGAEDPDALIDELTSTPFYHGLFLSEDHANAGLLIQTEILDAPGEREALVAGIDAALQSLRDEGFTTYLVGVPVIGATINHLSQSESMRYFPIAAVSSLVCLLLLLRSGRAALVVIICAAISIAITLGFEALLAQPLNLVTSAIPLVLWVLSLANCIHLVARYQHFRGLHGQPRDAVRMALGNVLFPCTLAAITTALGFISLMTADVSPVREFGLRMAVGILIAHTVNMVVGSWLLILFRVPVPRWWVKMEGAGFGWLANLINHYKWPIITVFSTILVFGAACASFIKSEPNSLKVLPEDHPTVEAYHYVGENLTGMYTLELLVRTPGGWLNPDYWPALESLREFFLKQDLVARVVSPLDFLKKVNQWEHDLDPEYYKLPESADEANALWDPLGDDEKEEIKRLVRAGGEEIRLSVLIRSTESVRFRELVLAANEEIGKLPKPMSAVVTGMVSRMEAMQRELVRTQVTSFALSFAMVFITVLLGMRSLRLTLISIPPNIFPILTVFSVMVLLGISLDAGTVMVASIALGIAVDNTLHVLAGFSREMAEGTPADVAIRSVLIEAGVPMSLTTITACIGFFTLTASSFVPIVNFGMLCGIAMAIALAADLVFVPAMLAAGALKPGRNE